MKTIIAKPGKLNQNRMKKCLSMRNFSKKADIDVATIHRIETLKTQRVSVSTAGKIIKALGVSFDDIFELVESSVKGA